ncbi:MAG: squalene synthase HpnC [Mariprofundales bacterium]
MNNTTPKQQYSIKQSYEHCQHIAAQHYENFPTASLLIAADIRPAIAAIYAFARHADDIADEGDADAETRVSALLDWQQQLQDCVHGESDQPIFLALSDTIKRYQLSPKLLNDLLLAFMMDIRMRAISNEKVLLNYCQHSANPIGRLVLALHGIDNPKALAASDAICTALQLSNFWQDLSIDLHNGRSYLTDDWLTPHCGEDILQNKYDGDYSNYMPALRTAIDYTSSLFDEGMALLPFLPIRLRLQIAATINGGRAILHAVENTEAPFITRPYLTKYSWIVLSTAIVRDTIKSYLKNTLRNKT